MPKLVRTLWFLCEDDDLWLMQKIFLSHLSRIVTDVLPVVPAVVIVMEPGMNSRSFSAKRLRPAFTLQQGSPMYRIRYIEPQGGALGSFVIDPGVGLLDVDRFVAVKDSDYDYIRGMLRILRLALGT